MPKHHKRLRTLAVGGVSLLGLALAGAMVLSGPSSQAQDKTVADQTTANPTVNRSTFTNQTYVAPKDTAAASPRTTATDTKATAASTSLTASRVKAPPVLLRRPMAPARVEWSTAMNQSARMKSVRKPNNLAARLPKLALDKTRLPVILPREGLIDTTKARMVSFGDAYALNMPQAKGMQITMYGNRSFVPGDKGAISSRPIQKLAGVAEDIRISQMEDGWTATFMRYGVVYSLDVSCDDLNSPDCLTDAYIRKAIAQFDDVTMGSEAKAEASAQAPAEKPTNWLDINSVSKAISKISKGG